MRVFFFFFLLLVSINRRDYAWKKYKLKKNTNIHATDPEVYACRIAMAAIL